MLLGAFHARVIAMVACSLHLPVVVRWVAAGFSVKAAGIFNQAAASTDVNGRPETPARNPYNWTGIVRGIRQVYTFTVLFMKVMTNVFSMALDFATHLFITQFLEFFLLFLFLKLKNGSKTNYSCGD